MVTVFDTSAIVAAHAQSHPQFAWVDAQLQEATSPALCAHSLAESYAVLTAHPQLRYSPVQVQAVLQRLLETWVVLPLIQDDYLQAIERCRKLSLPGGAIYDTLIAQAALRAQAQTLVTLNDKHFRRLGPEVAQLLVSPPSS